MEKYSSNAVRQMFPLLRDNSDLAYLDSGASSQKPDQVLAAMDDFYKGSYANVHRGIYELSEEATRRYEGAREIMARFLGGVEGEEVIFTKGTTEAVNLVATGLTPELKAGDEIVLTVAEHHSNIVPWQMLAARTGAKVKFIPLTEEWRLDLEEAARLINSKTKVVALAHVSNVLGVIHPVEKIVAMAKAVGAYTFVDAAQAAPHLRLDVRALGCDFYAFSGHKMVGPTGIGVLYGKRSRLVALPPYQGGGDMIERVTLEGSTWADLPNKFEAGTPPIAEAIGLGAAAAFLMDLPREAVLEHERSLGLKALEVLGNHPRVRVFTKPGPDWVGIVTFFHELIHPHDLAAIADSQKVCMRAGHHCAQPLMEVFGVPATARISPYLYNNESDIERFVKAFHKAEQLFA